MMKDAQQPPRREHVQQRVSKHRLTDLQQSLLQWLRAELRRRQRAGDDPGVAYPDLVRALRTDKASVTTSLRHLMRKGLIMTTLPRGSWVRRVYLTELGEAHASTLSRDARQQRHESGRGPKDERRERKHRTPRRSTHRKPSW